MQQVTHHAEHTLYAFGKQIDFLPCLKDRQLCRRKHAPRNELQAVFFLLLFLGNNLADRFLDKMYEPYQNQHIADVEASVERRQFERDSHPVGLTYLHKIGNNPVYHRQERLKQHQYPDYTEHIKHQMSHCRPACLRIGSQGRQVGRNRGSYIFSQHQSGSQFKTNPSVGTHNQRNGHGSRRSLYNHGQYSTNQDEQQDRKKAHVRIILNKGQHIRILTEVRSVRLQEIQSHEQKCKPEDKLTHRFT